MIMSLLIMGLLINNESSNNESSDSESSDNESSDSESSDDESSDNQSSDSEHTRDRWPSEIKVCDPPGQLSPPIPSVLATLERLNRRVTPSLWVPMQCTHWTHLKVVHSLQPLLYKH